MNIKNNITLFLLLFISSTFLVAQNKNELWYRFLVSHEFNKKFSLEGDYQYRWQGDQNNENLFDHKLGELFRLNFIYRFNQHFSIALAPFSHFKSNKLILQESDTYLAPSNEYRHILNLEYNLAISNRILFNLRSSNEYRTFTTSTNKIFRTRLRPGIRYNINVKHQLRFATEILMNAYGTNVTFFDQYRVNSDYFFRFYKNNRLNIGHIYNIRKRKDANNFIKENIISLGTFWNF